MEMPGFTAELSLTTSKCNHTDKALFDKLGYGEVFPMLDEFCTSCETVGGLGGIAGIGRRSCCRRAWVFNPITRRLEQSWQCYSERCTPDVVADWNI